MKALLLPILPKLVDRIVDNRQRYLFRRCRTNQPFKRILCAVREPAPTVVLEVLAGESYYYPISKLHSLFYRWSGMQPNEWNAYWSGVSEGYAVEVSAAVLVPEPKRFNPVQFYRLNQFPQNFCYVPSPGWPLGHPDTRDKCSVDDLFYIQEGRI